MKIFNITCAYGNDIKNIMGSNFNNIRGMPVEGEKELLLQRLKVLLQLEDRNRNARGYFLTQIFERNVDGRKFEVCALP